MDKIRVSAKTKDEAITKALIQLGITSDQLNYSVLVEGKSGLFGIGAKPWIIEAAVKEAAQKSELERLEKEIHNITTGQEAPKPAEEKKETAPKNEELHKTEETSEKTENVKAERREEKKPEPRTEEGARREKRERTDRGEHRPRRDRGDRNERRGEHSSSNNSRRYPRGGYEVKDIVIPSAAETERKVRELKPVSEEEALTAQKHAEEFITSVMKGMNMDVQLTTSFRHESNELMLNMEGPDMGLLIGKRGQTLDSLQYLTSLVVNKGHKEDYIRVKLDTEDYRSRRETTLRNLARNIAYKVRRSRKPVALEPMNPYERRIIHSALQNDRFVTTRSEGDEPFRHVIVFMKKKDRKPYPQNEKRTERSEQAETQPAAESAASAEENS